ncbi:hypothetical protein [Beggiatoa leptomitoformis]|uniref:Fe2OG dioxygenase domain-containing protein n=1 Tax=Beggiatoa leptomitoformis TaxID=288004 RepID=A0A2N9YFZ6_9GAMM|nr:hypothetical protein [Beggiatoa leptomitoformis]ALG68373.1 hypothetical protein AL038_12465 [Beggiatoa leptomitoformis]AUI69305.1 hypothetical protein BLE401_11800 [Beggiatoa leptomitoformis]
MLYLLGFIMVTVAGFYGFLFFNQQSRYQKISILQKDIIKQYQPTFSYPTEALPSFEQRVAQIPCFLPDSLFNQLRDVAIRSLYTERSYLPTHKKGGTVSYEALHQLAPELVAFYHSPLLQHICSALVGDFVVPTPLNDQSSCSLLVYEQVGDHINWHYDHNFYTGKHFTVLLSLVNENYIKKELSSAQLWIKQQEQAIMIPTPPNTLVIFEGATVLHKATKLAENERRVLLSMTFCTNPHAPVLKSVVRRIKDTAFFGIRALWT